MNIFRIKERASDVIAAIIGAIMIGICGIVFTFVLAPKQKIEAYQIERIPIMDAAAITELSAGEEALFTGYLTQNPVVQDEGFVTYILEKWVVTMPEDDPEMPDKDPDGKWTTVERFIEELSIDVNGEIVRTLAASNAVLSGDLDIVKYLCKGLF